MLLPIIRQVWMSVPAESRCSALSRDCRFLLYVGFDPCAHGVQGS